MKKIFLLACVCVSLLIHAQAPPVIEGTYYPVRNTSIKQVYDVAGSMQVPTIGPNQIWDYRPSNNQFLNVTDTFSFGFFDASSTPFHSHFPSATHATYVRTPYDNPSDSLYFYWEVTPDGLYNLGGYNIKNAFDSTLIHDNKEFFAPALIAYHDSIHQTTRTTLFANKFPISSVLMRVKIIQRKTKLMKYVGYGTLKIPNGTYNNVALVREQAVSLDSIFIDYTKTNNYVFAGTQTVVNNNYQFLRNNTFGSAFLMYLAANENNTSVHSAWYTLPVDFGSISGTVYTNATETNKVTNGEMYLYREHSNFVKNDILARTQVDNNGNFKFDSIPYGEYRIAVRPNTTLYPNSMITYFGDTTDWIGASTIITTTTTSSGHKIHLQYHPVPAGNNGVSGQLVFNPLVQKSAGITSSKPVPGIGIVIKKNPGSSSERNMVSDNNGEFHLGNIDDGSYRLIVDIPGLHMSGTYEFTVSNGSLVNNLDFTVGTDSIHPFSSPIGLKELNIKDDLAIMAYPNPYNDNTNIVFYLTSSQNITLEVLNVLGQKLQVLENGIKANGAYSYNFSAKKIGQPAGIYFIKLTAGTNSKVIKIIEH